MLHIHFGFLSLAALYIPLSRPHARAIAGIVVVKNQMNENHNENDTKIGEKKQKQ